MDIKVILKTNKGEINLKLFPEIAPITVTNFVALADAKFYDGIKFHRVIEDFMIQGGDPTGTGMGGPGYQFIDEFKQGVEFTKPGILAMANAGKNTNGSQFFITHVPTEWLNYNHTIFGEIETEADMDIVNKIKQNDIIESIEIIGDKEKLFDDNNEFYSQIKKVIHK